MELAEVFERLLELERGLKGWRDTVRPDGEAAELLNRRVLPMLGLLFDDITKMQAEAEHERGGHNGAKG